MRYLLWICAGMLLAAGAKGQALDPILSMWDQQPMALNPALTGNQPYKWRAALNYREVYYSVARPYRTNAVSFDINLPINVWSGNIWGFGLSILNDDVGESQLMNRRYNVSLGLGQYLDARQMHSLSVGFQAGLGQRGIVYDNVYWDNQWVGEGFQTSLNPNEPLNNDVQSYADLSTGVQYQYHDNRLIDITAGIALFHFNQPDASLLSEFESQNLERKWNAHFQMQHRIQENGSVALRPSVLFTRQGNFDILMFGNDFRFIISEGTRTTGKRRAASIDLGVHHRWGTDMIGRVIFNLAGLQFGASYDIAIGNVSNVSGNIIGPEFFIGYRAGFKKGLFNQYNRWNKGKL